MTYCDECSEKIEGEGFRIEHLVFCSKRCAGPYARFLGSSAFKKGDE